MNPWVVPLGAWQSREEEGEKQELFIIHRDANQSQTEILLMRVLGKQEEEEEEGEGEEEVEGEDGEVDVVLEGEEAHGETINILTCLFLLHSLLLLLFLLKLMYMYILSIDTKKFDLLMYVTCIIHVHPQNIVLRK